MTPALPTACSAQSDWKRRGRRKGNTPSFGTGLAISIKEGPCSRRGRNFSTTVLIGELKYGRFRAARRTGNG